MQSVFGLRKSLDVPLQEVVACESYTKAWVPETPLQQWHQGHFYYQSICTYDSVAHHSGHNSSYDHHIALYVEYRGHQHIAIRHEDIKKHCGTGKL